MQIIYQRTEVAYIFISQQSVLLLRNIMIIRPSDNCSIGYKKGGRRGHDPLEGPESFQK